MCRSVQSDIFHHRQDQPLHLDSLYQFRDAPLLSGVGPFVDGLLVFDGGRLGSEVTAGAGVPLLSGVGPFVDGLFVSDGGLLGSEVTVVVVCGLGGFSS